MITNKKNSIFHIDFFYFIFQLIKHNEKKMDKGRKKRKNRNGIELQIFEAQYN